MIRKPATQTLSILQFAASGLGLLFLLGLASIGLVFNLVQSISSAGEISFTANIRWLELALLSLLLIPSTFFSLLKLTGRSPRSHFKINASVSLMLILLWPPLLLFANWLLSLGSRANIGFVLAAFVATLVLALWIFSVASHNLPKSSPQRNWGLLAAGLLGGPIFSIAGEIALFVLIGAGLVVLLFIDPRLMDELNILATRISTAGADLEALKRILLPYTARPEVRITILFLLSVAVPLIEEAVKPIGLWFLSRRKLRPSQGFLGGMVCGASFAIFENLLSSNPVLGESWLLVASMRFGTTLMHMLGSGLVGWSLAHYWQGGSAWRLAGAYLAAVTLHGAWNALALLLGIQMLGQTRLSPAGMAYMVGLAVITLAAFGLLVWMNSWLQKAEKADIADPAEPLLENML